MPQQVERIPGEDQPDSSRNTETPEWVEQEIAGCSFPDQRLRQRLQQLLQQFSSGLGESIPFACQDWAHTKADLSELSFRAAPAKLNENNRALRTMDQERRGWRNHREVEAVELSDPERAGLSK
jgi:hypothetical protein